ncbi:Arm DNA-binding domain-containing protein [Autumnicola musiva]|uniref:Arm DNA-binding domain-containing protein n=1 Tax=Autumnicola musiva TaxID=3075589 RepID=A0ABU3D8X0_9FLAO|nr:Arm DNA-binding domain-containing protein [Zunongwangia sp. F117]MDT0677795.1 Arm DNA-binding domain-containing protein [Zunongwangia sp. F117]
MTIMRTSNTFSVLFWVDPKREVNHHVMIYARITVNQKRVLVSLKQKISIDLWDFQKRRAKGSSTKAKQINHYLDSVKARFFHCYQELTSKGKKLQES